MIEENGLSDLENIMLAVNSNDYEPGVVGDPRILEAAKKTFMVELLQIFAAVLIVLGVACSITSSFGVLLTGLCTMVCIMAMYQISESGYLFENSALKKQLVSTRNDLVINRIALLEIKLGGIYQYSSYFNFQKLKPEQVESCVTIFKKSASREAILDIDTYFLIMSSISAQIHIKANNARLNMLENEVKALADFKPQLASTHK